MQKVSKFSLIPGFNQHHLIEQRAQLIVYPTSKKDDSYLLDIYWHNGLGCAVYEKVTTLLENGRYVDSVGFYKSDFIHGQDDVNYFDILEEQGVEAAGCNGHALQFLITPVKIDHHFQLNIHSQAYLDQMMLDRNPDFNLQMG
jgi:hypothetical protein